MEQEFASLDDIIAQRNQETPQEGMLFENLGLQPVQVVASAGEENLLQKIGGYFSRGYQNIKNFYATAPEFVTTLTYIYAGMNAYDLLLNPEPTSALGWAIALGTQAYVIGLVGRKHYKEFKEIRNDLKMNGWDEGHMLDLLENRPPLKEYRFFGREMTDAKYKKLLGRAAEEAGYAKEFQAMQWR